MKKFYVFGFAAVLMLSAATAFGQAKKYPLFEHFTQASCGPCASQNPFFQAVYEENTTNMHHIAYHTSWPGTDPMYDANPAESEDMVSYYTVSGVPTMILDGATFGSPAGVTQDVVTEAASAGSPVRIIVTEETVGSTRNVNIEVQTVGTVAAGTWKLKGAVVERLVDYATPPGSNGETEFPNVFREGLISGTAGVTITPAAIGSSVSYDYSYELDASWVEEEIYVVAWLQNSSTKEILNSGATGDPGLELANTTENIFTQAGGSFNAVVSNVGTAGEGFTISFDANQPADWSASYTYAGMTYTGDYSTSLSAGVTEDVVLNVSTGTTPGVGEYTITVTSDNPDINPMAVKYYTISGVTDLVVNNVEAFGDGAPYGTFDFESYYTDGLANAGNTTYGVAGDNVFVAGMRGDALNEVKNIYFNVGWTFPALTKDDLRLELENFLDNGGNLFVSGQDIGWEVDYYADNGLPAANNFFEDYLHASFVNDAASGAESIAPVAEDAWFNTALESDIAETYGSEYYYPDQIETSDADGFEIFAYTGGTKIGGVRSETDDYKTVFLGIGLEMVADEAVRDQIMKLSHDYFYGVLNGIEFDQAMQNLLGNASPNPAQQFTNVTFNGLESNVQMVISDVSGRVIQTLQVPAGTTNMEIDVTGMESGMYFYHITDGINQSAAQKLNVVK
jgi:thiol-disulfide isomerase/thioredoxin